MSFCTAINCMDGRTQLPVINYLLDKYNTSFVDSITEPGPVLILAEQQNPEAVKSILRRVDISVNKHKSKAIAIVAHHDCAGNPDSKDNQLKQLEVAVKFIAAKYPDTEVIGLWVGENWQVEKID